MLDATTTQVQLSLFADKPSVTASAIDSWHAVTDYTCSRLKHPLIVSNLL